MSPLPIAGQLLWEQVTLCNTTKDKQFEDKMNASLYLRPPLGTVIKTQTGKSQNMNGVHV